jgi:hypothetical protein
VNNGVGAVSCNGTTTLTTNPTATTTYTLTVTNAGGGTTTAQATVYCAATSNPARAGGCPTGATTFCESAPIAPTTEGSAVAKAQSLDACNACNAGCTDDPSELLVGFGSASIPPGADGTVFYVYAAGTQADNNCVPPTYFVQPGDIIAGPTCPASTW